MFSYIPGGIKSSALNKVSRHKQKIQVNASKVFPNLPHKVPSAVER